MWCVIAFTLIHDLLLFYFRQGFSIMGKRPEIGWCEFRYPLEENITDPKLYAASLEDLFMLRRDSI